MRGDSVRWLRDSLSAINPGYDSRSVDVDLFDEDLEAQLRNFQRRNRLKVDGVAGQQTLIIINSRLVQQGTPRLTAG